MHSFHQTYFLLLLIVYKVNCLPLTSQISNPLLQTSTHVSPPPAAAAAARLSGDWQNAKHTLRKQDCCIVSIKGLEHHMEALQHAFVTKGPANIDLRARVRIPTPSSQPQEHQVITEASSSNIDLQQVQLTSYQHTITDCRNIRHSVVPIVEDQEYNNLFHHDACTSALVELALGVVSLAEGSLEKECKHVFIRIVCASDYKAIDPPYHTDKAPLRGYVTLKGLGTEFVNRTCSPMEYAMLRMFGTGVHVDNIQKAKELEFIVMKGDYYTYQDPNLNPWSWDSIMNKIWQRNKACIHRSPPAVHEGGLLGRRRVIVSLDLDDGLDDREWYDVDKSREWRLGMTQRKSRLVA